ncbi:hypothetical protein ACFSLT_04130 [Novosphingobium resinovorum]
MPSWQWRHGGRDRAVAREAFATALPAQITARRSKGAPIRSATPLSESIIALSSDAFSMGTSRSKVSSTDWQLRNAFAASA